jgi:hypothetical protein
MDDQELTPWQEINPPMASAGLPALHSAPSPMLPARLVPATPDEMQQELAACLALSGASGMSEDDRCEWLRAARLTLEGIPADLLAQGCRKARATCDHPSKIVPAIMADVTDQWRWRKESRPVQAQPEVIPPERRIEQPLTPDQVDEMNEIMARAGASTRYRPDGSRYEAETSPQARQERGPPRKPTRADYIALGVDPSILDQTGKA